MGAFRALTRPQPSVLIAASLPASLPIRILH
jgi:hypothetical protein